MFLPHTVKSLMTPCLLDIIFIHKLYSFMLFLSFKNEHRDNGLKFYRPKSKECPPADKDVCFPACLMISHCIMFIRLMIIVTPIFLFFY